MITDWVDTSPEGIELARRAYTLHLEQAAQWASDPESFGGEMTVLSGLNCMLYGLTQLARAHLELAVPMLLRKLLPDVPDIEGRLLPASAAELEADIPEAMRDKVQLAGGSAVIPFDAYTKSEWWTCLGLCRWVLEQRHDAESFKRAADELDRCFATQQRDPNDSGWLDDQGRVFCAARDYERMIAYFSRDRPKFKPPRRPSNVRSERALSWILATHHLRGEWSDDQLAKAWDSFFTFQVPRFLSGGGMLGLTNWLKLRFWDQAEHRPNPFETFLRLYDYLPGIRRPDIQL